MSTLTKRNRSDCFQVEYALITRITNELCNNSSYPYREGAKNIDINRARQEQEMLIDMLRRIHVDVIELPSDERLPDGLFIADCAVIINGTALICNPPSLNGQPRQGELTVVRQVLRKELGLKIAEVDCDKGEVLLCGTDVLWTGREIFVGIGKMTNILGAQSVAKAFPEFSTSIVNIRPPFVHLKDCVSLCGPEILAVSKMPEAKKMLSEMRQAGHGYKMLELEEFGAPNTLYCNNTVLHLSREIIPRSHDLFKDKLEFQCIPVDLHEPLKRGCGLNNVVLLVGRHKNMKYIQTTAMTAQ